MVVISDTTAITYLLQINQLEIISILFGRVIIPFSVFQELRMYHGEGLEIELKKFEIEIYNAPLGGHLSNAEKQKLDKGEEHAIELALKLNADLLIVDEKLGRRIAKEHGLQIIGMLGVLIQAKGEGHLHSLKQTVDQLRSSTSFRISEKLYNIIIEYDD